MIIKVGATYKDGWGNLVTIVQRTNNHKQYIFIGDNNYTYTAFGVYDESDPQPSEDNLRLL